jgi:hypothetical protein
VQELLLEFGENSKFAVAADVRRLSLSLITD